MPHLETLTLLGIVVQYTHMQAQRISACLPAQTPAMLPTPRLEECCGKIPREPRRASPSSPKKRSGCGDLPQPARAAVSKVP